MALCNANAFKIFSFQISTIHSNNNFNEHKTRQFSVIKVHYRTLLFERQSVKPWRKRQNGSFDSSPSMPLSCPFHLEHVKPANSNVFARLLFNLLLPGELVPPSFPGTAFSKSPSFPSLFTIDSLVTSILSLFPVRNLDPDEGSNSFWNRLRGG